jgi:hypothetical protein
MLSAYIFLEGTVTTVQQIQAPSRSTRLRQRLLVVGAAVLAALLVWIIAVPVLGVDLRGPAGPGSTTTQPVVLPAVIALSLGASLAAWALLAVLERVTGRARYIWNVVAVAVLIISYGGPLLGAGVPTASRITLALMHSAVGGVLLARLPRTSTAR